MDPAISQLCPEGSMSGNFRQLSQFNGDPDASRIVICGKTQLHHWDPETKRESIQWKHKGSQTSNKFETQPSAGKIMATMFWDSVGVLLIGYLEHRKNREIYISKLLMDLRHEEIKRPGKLTNGVLLLHDNAPVHTARVVQASLWMRIVTASPLSGPYYIFR
ncbi:hypothetical protein LAZ67_5003232 [Cordylochernes scorpioides]|uniref:Transposase n=1 Tax=Cordylochernes scorpioides TaxID=51811 RepID=A0ABY6KKN6_9ARAC|nr:hypothetical protein LAZ67_5003232 [Cordylochernes scorpioides]